MTPPGTSAIERYIISQKSAATASIFMRNNRFCPAEACLRPTILITTNDNLAYLFFDIQGADRSAPWALFYFRSATSMGVSIGLSKMVTNFSHFTRKA